MLNFKTVRTFFTVYLVNHTSLAKYLSLFLILTMAS